MNGPQSVPQGVCFAYLYINIWIDLLQPLVCMNSKLSQIETDIHIDLFLVLQINSNA